MGGVDLLDRLLSSYRPTLRSKKWWWNAFSNALNMVAVAAWLLHKDLHSNESLSHLEFRRQVTMGLLRILKRRDTPRTGPKIAIPQARGKTDFLVQTTHGRCAHCSTNAHLECNECKNKLHLHFPAFHGI